MSDEFDAPQIIAILGTNTSGKSDLAVHLASKFRGEIVSADSRQVYRGLDLGTGKLPVEMRSRIPHYLIDVATVGEKFSLAHYQLLAYAAIDQILGRQKLPILAGGTGLYLESVLDGYQLVDVPPNYELREELERKTPEDLAATLRSVDFEAASRIDPRNTRRMIRALEIRFSGCACSSTRKKALRYRSLRLGVTWPWGVLCERIDRRLQMRLDSGMVDEVRDLINAGVTTQALDDLGLEYRHIVRYFQGLYQSREEMYEKLRLAIRKFARRQLSWFRRDPNIVWLDTSGDYYIEAERYILGWYDPQKNSSSLGWREDGEPRQEYSFTVLYEPAEEGGYVVTCPALPGLVTEGETLEEAREMARDGIRGYLESLRKDGLPIPEDKKIDLPPVKEEIRVAFPAEA